MFWRLSIIVADKLVVGQESEITVSYVWMSCVQPEAAEEFWTQQECLSLCCEEGGFHQS